MNSRFNLFTYTFLFVLLFSNALNAQSDKYEEAEMLFQDRQYEKAKRIFHDLYYSSMDNDMYKYRLGLCYLFTLEEEEAGRLIVQVNALEDYTENLHRLFYLARCQHLNENYEAAIKNYQSYLDTYKNKIDEFNETLELEVVLPAIYGGSADLIKDPVSLEQAIQRLISECEYGIKLSENPRRVAIENAGDIINSKFAEYAPVVNAEGDELFFARKVEVEKDEFAERLFYSEMTGPNEWSKPREIVLTDDPSTDIAPLYISPSNDFGLIYDSRSNNGDIFEIIKKGGKWEEGEPFPKSINSKHWEPSASLFPDGNTLVFSSNRPDGYGGLDLYMSQKNDKGKWTDPINLGPEINSPFDEDAPFILYDEPKMYFSSRGHQTLGGYDIFETKFENGKWTKPENMKTPINTPYDDIYFTWTEDGRRAYFSSHRIGTRGANDIYYMDFNQITLNVFVKEETDEGLTPLHVNDVSLEHMSTGTMIDVMEKNNDKGLTVFFTKEDEMYMLRVKSPHHIPYVESMRLRRGAEFVAAQKKEIILKQEGEPIYEEEEILDESERAVPAPIAKSGKSIELEGKKYYIGDVLKYKVHFVLNEAEYITDYSKAQMDKVIEILNENPELDLHIIAHADRSGNSEYNKTLSQRRSVSVKNYFLENGIDESRLKGSWKGDKDPIIDTDTPELRNRRVEFQIVSL